MMKILFLENANAISLGNARCMKTENVRTSYYGNKAVDFEHRKHRNEFPK